MRNKVIDNMHLYLGVLKTHPLVNTLQSLELKNNFNTFPRDLYAFLFIDIT
jgi:hypothetical protein